MREKKAKTWNMGLKYFEEFVKRNFNEEDHHREESCLCDVACVYVGRSGICALVRASFDVRSHTTIVCKVDRSGSGRGAGNPAGLRCTPYAHLPSLHCFSFLPFHSSIFP
jgi:hypothetical protein